MRNYRKKQFGITLIALILTIIVLLILAGVTFNGLLGDNGILKRASEAKRRWEEAAENEKDFFGELEKTLNEYDESDGSKESEEVDITDWDLTNAGPYITKALEDAEDKGETELTLPKETYYINGANNNNDQNELPSDTEAIIIPSGIALNLNGSTLQLNENSSPSSDVVLFWNASNSGIKNGIIIGDKREHGYGNFSSTHEFGYGIRIVGSDITVENMDISDCTGDGIIVMALGSAVGSKISEDITIKNCDVHHSRRQGISIVGADGVLIEDCDIYGIGNDGNGSYSNFSELNKYATLPAGGIDIEPSALWKTENVTIKNNRFGTDADVEVNHENIQEDIILHRGCRYATVEGNTFKELSSQSFIPPECEQENPYAPGTMISEAYKSGNNAIKNNTIKNGIVRIVGDLTPHPSNPTIANDKWANDNNIISDNKFENAVLYVLVAHDTIINNNTFTINNKGQLYSNFPIIFLNWSNNVAVFNNTIKFDPTVSHYGIFGLYNTDYGLMKNSYTVYNVGNEITGTTTLVGASAAGTTLNASTNIGELRSYLAQKELEHLLD